MLWCRQRHPNGNEELLMQMERHFLVPPAVADARDSPDEVELFKQWIYLTQVRPLAQPPHSIQFIFHFLHPPFLNLCCIAMDGLSEGVEDSESILSVILA
jgi:hypothetical protein